MQQRFSRGPHLAPTASASNPDGPLHASAPPRPPPLVPPRIARAARRARERLSLVRERVEDRLETLLRHRPAARERTRSTRHHRRPPPPRAEGVRWLAVQRVPGARTARPEGGGFSDFSAAATFARSSSVALPSANFLPMPEEKPLYLQACTRRGTRSRSRSRPATRSRTTERAPAAMHASCATGASTRWTRARPDGQWGAGAGERERGARSHRSWSIASKVPSDIILTAERSPRAIVSIPLICPMNRDSTSVDSRRTCRATRVGTCRAHTEGGGKV